MKKLTILFALALLGLFAITSCNDNPSAERAEENMEEAAENMEDAMENDKNELRREINEAQADIDRRMEKLNNDLKEAKAEAKADIQADIDSLEVKRKQLAQDLNDFGNKADAEWDQFKANVKETIKDIGDNN